MYPTPEDITAASLPDPDDVLVTDGPDEGPHGNTYAIPVSPYDPARFREAVGRFLDYATECDQNTFYVTRIGCDGAGYTDAQVAPLFSPALSLYNIRLPRPWLTLLGVETSV